MSLRDIKKDLIGQIEHHADVLLHRFGVLKDRLLYQTAAIFYFERRGFGVENDRLYRLPCTGTVRFAHITADLVLDNVALILVRAEPEAPDLEMILASYVLLIPAIRYGIALNFNSAHMSQALGNIIIVKQSDVPLVGQEGKRWDVRSNTFIF